MVGVGVKEKEVRVRSKMSDGLIRKLCGRWNASSALLGEYLHPLTTTEPYKEVIWIDTSVSSHQKVRNLLQVR